MEEDEAAVLRAKVLAIQTVVRAMVLVLRGSPATTDMTFQMKEVALRTLANLELPLATVPGGDDVLAAVYAEVERLFAPSPTEKRIIDRD